ncbi:GrpB family protein (plasmid) [Agrobacterium sp. rho-8.1]|nr:GrpB family protein [Agrobacterium sp. rho-8.1]
MSELIVINAWSSGWTSKFRSKAERLRNELGPLAMRIDHIGSTAIHGLAAKPIIDIQISVETFGPVEALVAPLERCGYTWRSTNPELTKRYFRELPGDERTHIHVRRSGSWHEQWALLFRDYMREHVDEHAPYVALKSTLAECHGTDRAAYTDGKDDFFWNVIRRADRWAAVTGWQPPPSDA